MSARGTYALLLELDAPRKIKVGALGTLDFPPGYFLYVGSALGPGGLTARLARHRRRTGKRLHWHIDHVRAVMTLVEVWTSQGEMRQECDWAVAASTLPGANIVASGLGASDCHCPSHLLHYRQRPKVGDFQSLIHTELESELVKPN
jgi:Uri superfamily endonuclease